MFGYAIDLGEVRRILRGVLDAQWRTFAGLVFMALAMAAIEYDEFIAPEVSRISDGWSTVATDFSRRLASFTL
jgi:uncharacterized membrane protein